MPLPRKGVKKSQLKWLTAGAVVKDGSHEILKAVFIEDGVEKEAFYKSVDVEHRYPQLLAKISVATAVIKRSFQGKNTAEERLVFDDNNNIVGTLSLAIPKFKPLNYLGEPIPIDAAEKELVIPSAQMLIQKNVIAILLGRRHVHDDDVHPHNFSIAGEEAADIDNDMSFYRATIGMKGERPIIGDPRTGTSFTVRDWEAFPCIKDAKLYHWPTYNHPGKESLPSIALTAPVQDAVLSRVLPKAYADPTQFQLLASSKEAQEQKLAAAMKILTSYQPEAMRARLEEHFGMMPLDYTSLGQELTTKYQTELPELFNSETNARPFIDFMMTMYQEYYDEFYRVVVFYMGCDNNGYDIKLSSTHESLFLKPSLYQNVKAWVIGQNKNLYNKDSATQYKLDVLEKRYHQIWRDACAPKLKLLLEDLYQLISDVLEWTSAKKSSELAHEAPITTKVSPKDARDGTLASAWELFGVLELSQERINKEIAVGPSSELRPCLQAIVEFTQALYAYAKAYYVKRQNDLAITDNTEFITQLIRLCTQYERDVMLKLANTSHYGIRFGKITKGLMDFAKQADFEMHLKSTDAQIQQLTSIVPAQELAPTSPAALAQFNRALFCWANQIKPEELTRLVNEIIDKYYSPTYEVISNRKRASTVKAYLNASIKEHGQNRLAHILSSGTAKAGSLNTLLIQYLTPEVLKVHSLSSMKIAQANRQFEAHLLMITQSVIEFAKNDGSLFHLCHGNEEGIKLFYHAFYQWVEGITKERFAGIISQAKKAYDSTVWAPMLWGASRSKEIDVYLREPNQAKVVAMIFQHGKDSSTMNERLFSQIINEMKKDIKEGKIKELGLGYKFIEYYDEEEHKMLVYTTNLKKYTEGPSHKRTEASYKKSGSVYPVTEQQMAAFNV